jgi:hypothetical protein
MMKNKGTERKGIHLEMGWSTTVVEKAILVGD